MENVITIFKRDLKVILKNPIPLIITLGAAFLPSLYAWVNIAASWDPYSTTSTIPIAVVNNDEGTEFNGKNLNVGNEVIENLKKNDEIGWKFTTSREAELGIMDSTYYASIEIPENFSSDLTSLLSDNPQKPTIIYKVDTKENPVANKITTVAQESLIKEIKTNFLTTVNETVFTSLNGVGEKLQENKDQIIAFKNIIIKLNKNLDLILNSLDYAGDNAQNLNTYFSELSNTLPQINDSLNNIKNGNNTSIELAENTSNAINTALSSLDTNINMLNSNKEKMNILLNDINNSTFENAETLNQSISSMNEEIKSTYDTINALADFLSAINNNDLVSSNEIAELAALLKNLSSSLNEQSSNLDNLNNYYLTSSSINKDILNNINSNNNDINNKITESINSYNNTTRNIITNICNDHINQLQKTNNIIDQTKGMTDDIRSILSSVSNGSKLTGKLSNDLKEKLNYFRDSISFLSENLEGVSDDDLTKIISILQSDPALMADYISTPFSISNEPIYKLDNYGSGMTPIYSVLAMWVGAVILTSIFSPKVKGVEGSEKFTSKEKYLGKLLLFGSLAIIQGLIIMMGNKLILGVQTSNLLLFMLFGALISLSFSIIVYTNVYLFGDIGKALNVILLVMQLAGSGGAYPIQVAPLIFRILQPFFPFTYALSAVRESIAGVLISQVTLDFIMLLIFSGISLLFGLFLKDKVSKPINRFHKKFEKSGLAE